MAETYWLREETKKNEFRRALTPDSCLKLIDAGHSIVVEQWDDSIIPIEEYERVGCKISKAGSWVNSPKETIIVGLKALPDNIDRFIHRHIFFAHVFKEQDGWKELLQKFKQGDGRIIDLEYMVNEQGRRVCAFGYWAGYVGAALGALFSQSRDLKLSIAGLSEKMRFPDKSGLIEYVQLMTEGKNPEAIVIGCQGRSGKGAIDCLKELNWDVTGWDKVDTQSGGPFSAILNYDLFVNCVLALGKMPPFINKELIEQNPHKLNMISDVSCDPDSDCNMVPLYKKATVLSSPVFNVQESKNPLGIVAIDNLPSILPRESSLDFSSQLFPFLLDLGESNIPVNKALAVFKDNLGKL